MMKKSLSLIREKQEKEEREKEKEKNLSNKALKRLNRDLKILKKIENSSNNDFSVNLTDENSLYKWKITLHSISEGTNLDKEFKKNPDLERKVVFEFTFPQSFPFKPPNVRVIYPRFTPGKSYILKGGAICINTFTPKFWSPIFSIETCLYSVISLLNQDNLPNEIVSGVEYTKKEGEESLMKIRLYHPDWFSI